MDNNKEIFRQMLTDSVEELDLGLPLNVVLENVIERVLYVYAGLNQEV